MAHRLDAALFFHLSRSVDLWCERDWGKDALAAAAAAVVVFERSTPSPPAGTGLVSRAHFQLLRPFRARWRVVAALSPRASLAALPASGGKAAEECLKTCRPGFPPSSLRQGELDDGDIERSAGKGEQNAGLFRLQTSVPFCL